MKKNNLSLILIMILIVSLVSCGGKSSKSSKSSSLSSSRIESASSEQIEQITSAIKHGATVSNFKTVKSKDFENVYFVSAIITNTLGNKLTGIWATGGKRNISMIMSANSAAKQYSPWPYGPDTRAGVSYTDDGGRLLINSY